MDLTSPTVTVDLDALAANYQLLADMAGNPPIAMVKANAYGVGIEPVAERLWAEGCRSFFVARLQEGIELRTILPSAEIGVLDGVVSGGAEALVEYELIPALNDLGQIERWRNAGQKADRNLPAALHFDSGMHRLGIPSDEQAILGNDKSLLNGIAVAHVMSHLACADDDVIAQSNGRPIGPSASQLEKFRQTRSLFPAGRASLANSAGIFLGADFHFDLCRPGIALYGGSPWGTALENPMRPVVTVEAPVLQVQNLAEGESIGYGASWRADRPSVLATIPIGYADGYHRQLSSNTRVAFAGHGFGPVVGRVSMDLTLVDITDLPGGSVQPGTLAEVVGALVPVDEVAEAAGTISYELLTGLSSRYQRRYLGIS